MEVSPRGKICCRFSCQGRPTLTNLQPRCSVATSLIKIATFFSCLFFLCPFYGQQARKCYCNAKQQALTLKGIQPGDKAVKAVEKRKTSMGSTGIGGFYQPPRATDQRNVRYGCYGTNGSFWNFQTDNKETQKKKCHMHTLQLDLLMPVLQRQIFQ